MKIIYSRTQIPYTGGIKAVNPVFFYEPEKDVTEVFLNGDFPNIKAAYEAIGVPVKPFAISKVKKIAVKNNAPKKTKSKE